MAGGARLEYDDSGSTFYYFLLSFYFLILLPITYFLIPRKKKGSDENKLVCQCEPCINKKVRLENNKPRKRFSGFLRYAILVILWGVFLVMVYKVATLDKDYVEYDPFEILQLDPGAEMSTIKKQYRKLSKVYHPDKQGGDQEMFMRIAKAYEALTDDVSRENWEKYGNPDGPQAAHFGIALPAWIVEKKNSIWVLAAYMAVFMIGLPSIVGLWWYRSVKYGTTNVLLQTTQLFQYYLTRSRTIPYKRIIIILSGAMEFNSKMSNLVPSRPSDDDELSEILMSKALPHINAKIREKGLGTPWAVKAQILLHSHLEKKPLYSPTLEADQRAVLKLCPQLLQDMLSSMIQFWAYYLSQKRPGGPSLDSMEEVMRVSSMLVQGMWSLHSPLMQLPHLTLQQLRHFKTKRRNISTIEQFASLPPMERRKLVRSLSDEEYSDIQAVCALFPHVTIDAEIQVVDDENNDRVTVDSLVTLTVTLKRSSLLEAGVMQLDDTNVLDSVVDGDEPESVETIGPIVPIENHSREDSFPAAASSKKLMKKGGGTSRKKAKGPAKQRRRTANPKKAKKGQMREEVGDAEEEEDGRSRHQPEGGGDRSSSNHSNSQTVRKRKQQKRQQNGGSSSAEDDNDEEDLRESEDEEEWSKLQQSVQKYTKKKFEQSKTESPLVHAPFFPIEKNELWWLYVVDKRCKELICPPQRVTGMLTEHKTDLHFNAPSKANRGIRYTVVLRSDSYLDLYFTHHIDFSVGAKQEVKGHSQWADLEEEEEEEEAIEESLSEIDSDDDDLEDSD